MNNISFDPYRTQARFQPEIGRHAPSVSTTMNDSDNKIRRTARACRQCRTRKQRCNNGEDAMRAGSPCQRCRMAGKACSFESEDSGARSSTYTRYRPYSSSATVEDLQAELAEHKARLEALESAVGIPAATHAFPASSAASETISSPSSSNGTSQVQVASTPTSKPFSINGLSLDAPLAMVQTLRKTLSDEDDSIDADRATPGTAPASFGKRAQSLVSASIDPIVQGVLSIEDAQQCFDIFFARCHEAAPCMCIRTQRDAMTVRSKSMVLFNVVCSIGARFWNFRTTSPRPESMSNPSPPCDWLHPKYADIVDIVDQSLTTLLLRPSSSSSCVESIQATLLYTQWMPLEIHQPDPSSSQVQFASKSRFNDVSAWTSIGIAIRQAVLIRLDKVCIDAPLKYHGGVLNLDDEDAMKMRVWMNLLSLDRFLNLTARLPTSLDPEPAARIARAFGSHPRAEPSDMKAAGLCELVAIIHRAAKSCGDPSLCALDSASLSRANKELNEWERIWSVVLSNRGFEHYYTQMPFTSLRWYRLALNVVCLGPAFFGREQEPDNSAWLYESLRIGIEAATAMLYCFSRSDSFDIDTAALAGFRFSIDAYWITHAFAVVFLALAYDRGAVDDGLTVQTPHQRAIFQHTVNRPPPPRESSLLYRLIQLASDIFDCSATHPPAAYYRDIVKSTFTALKERTDPPNVQRGTSSQSDVFGMIMEDGFDWTFDDGTYGLAGPPMSW